MKKITLFIILISIFVIRTNAEDGWYWQNPQPQGNALMNIHAFDSYRAIAVGGDGTIMKTDDQGIRWTIQYNVCGSASFLMDVHFIDENTGWVVGTDGTILKTSNDGSYWMPQNSGTKRHLYSVFFIDQDIGMAVGSNGTILRTVDGGDNWESMSESAYDDYMCIYFINRNVGWIVGTNTTIFKTVDGGENWIPQTNPLSYVNYYAVFFIDEQVGWIASDLGRILSTRDGGQKWNVHQTSVTESLDAIYFTDDQHGWAVLGYGTCYSNVTGSTCKIFRTINGGQTWLPIYLPVQDSKWFHSVFFVNQAQGWIVGDGGSILFSSDGGTRWHYLNQGPGDYLFSVHFADADNGWIAADFSTIWRTRDGGETWEVKRYIENTADVLGGIYFIDENVGWATGWGGNSAQNSRWRRKLESQKDLHGQFAVVAIRSIHRSADRLCHRT